MYNLATPEITSTEARQRWAGTLDAAKKSPVRITSHGREVAVVMSVEVADNALAALDDVLDAAAAEAALAGPPTSGGARELGLSLDE